MQRAFRAALAPAAAAARSVKGATIRAAVSGRPRQQHQAAAVPRPGGMLAEVQQRLPAAAGGLRALAPALPMSAQGSSGARSVGHVQGNMLRGNVVEAWEKQKVLVRSLRSTVCSAPTEMEGHCFDPSVPSVVGCGRLYSGGCAMLVAESRVLSCALAERGKWGSLAGCCVETLGPEPQKQTGVWGCVQGLERLLEPLHLLHGRGHSDRACSRNSATLPSKVRRGCAGGSSIPMPPWCGSGTCDRREYLPWKGQW
jgi:hypothetical protein